MTTEAITFNMSPVQNPIGDTAVVEGYRHDNEARDREPLWRQIKEILATSLPAKRQELESTQGQRAVSTGTLVAPGILVGETEYRERFEGLDIDYYRQRMPAALFGAFVRHIGAIQGLRKLDIVELTSNTED